MPDFIETTDIGVTPETAGHLEVDTSYRGTISTRGDHDIFGIYLQAGQTYTFAMVGTGVVDQVRDTYLTLFNENGDPVGDNDDDGPGSFSSLTFTATTDGVHYIDAGAYGDAGTGQYGLSVTTGTRASYDEEMAAGVLARPLQTWSALGTAATVTWAAQETLNNITDSSGNPVTGIALSAAQTVAMQAILAGFSEVANISFVQVNPGGTSDDAIIRVAAYENADDAAGAYALFPGDPASDSLSGDVRLNNSSVSPDALPAGEYSYFAVMHEVGHALGLDHPGDYNATPGIDILYANDAQFIQDTQQYTVMSYFDEAETNGSDAGFADTLMLYDILALQQMYGVNTTTRTGNTIYGFGSTAGAVYNFALNTDPLFSIWDAGGLDTLDASGFAMDQLLDLREGRFSNIGGFSGNVSIAFGAVIENATGGAGNDTFVGNLAANRFAGGLGNDSYIVNDTSDVVFEARDEGTDTIIAYANYTLSNSSWVERLQLAGSADHGIGNNIANVITGGVLNDVLEGRKGDDVLDGSFGTDTLIGGTGNDTYYVDNADDVVVEARGEGEDTVIASVSYALSNTSWVDDLVLAEGSISAYSAVGNDIFNTIWGNEFDNQLLGMGGNDTLYGLGGGDSLNGGLGEDRMFGGTGDDVYYVDNKDDYAVEAIGEGTDLIVASVSYSLSNIQFVENLRLVGTGNLNARGNNLDNVINGNSGNNVIEGRRGGDLMIGGGGNDTFVWNATNESFGSNTDTIGDLRSGDVLDLHLIDADLTQAGDQGFFLASAFTNKAGQMVFSYDSGTRLTTLLLDVNGDSTADMRILFNGDQTGHTNFIF